MRKIIIKKGERIKITHFDEAHKIFFGKKKNTEGIRRLKLVGAHAVE